MGTKSTPSSTPLIHTSSPKPTSAKPTPVPKPTKPVSMQPWQKIRARRYCAAPEGAEPGFIHWTDVATFIGGSKETDERLTGLNKCQKELKDKVVAKPVTVDKERTAELMDLAIKRQICVRAKTRGHFDDLPCKKACEEVLKAYKRKSESIKITNKE